MIKVNVDIQKKKKIIFKFVKHTQTHSLSQREEDGNGGKFRSNHRFTRTNPAPHTLEAFV